MHIFDPATIAALFAQFQSEMQQPAFWVAVGKIMWINVLLSGDNALVIAMACRALEPRQRLWGMILGAGVAVILRIIFTGIVATLMALPYLKLVGGLALILIAAKLVVPEEEDEGGVQSASHLWHAVQIVVVADIVMSLDNVIAVAAAANGSLPLLVLGLAISVPLIVAGAALIMALLNRLPILVWAGAALLGWIAGDVIATDPAIHPHLQAFFASPWASSSMPCWRSSAWRRILPAAAMAARSFALSWASSSCWPPARSGAGRDWRRLRLRGEIKHPDTFAFSRHDAPLFCHQSVPRTGRRSDLAQAQVPACRGMKRN